MSFGLRSILLLSLGLVFTSAEAQDAHPEQTDDEQANCPYYQLFVNQLSGTVLWANADTRDEFRSRKGALIEPGGDCESGGEFLSMSQQDPGDSTAGKPGIARQLPAAFEQEASGKTVEVTVVARRSRGSGTQQFAAVYSTADTGNSGWILFDLSDHFENYTFQYAVPPMVRGNGDYIGLIPDTYSAAGKIDIAAISAEILQDDPQSVTPSARSAIAANKPVNSLSSAFYDVSVERFQISHESNIRGGITRVKEGIIYGAQNGDIYHLPRLEDRIKAIDLDTPVPLDGPHEDLKNFNRSHMGLYDIAAEPRPGGGKNNFDLYASHFKYSPRKKCVFLELSKIGFEMNGARIRFDSEWESVFQARPCLSLKWMKRISLMESGGRIAFVRDGIILSIGTFSVDGQREKLPTASQEDDFDYGKIIRLSRDDFEKTVISKGHRNPQGLYVDASGQLFSTEHGPRGGDEVNLIRSGGNYGWPNVTYGTDYGRKLFRHFDEQGKHQGYDKPIFAFVPSIGISQIIRIESADEFPIWQGDLLVASLDAKTLFRLHMQEGRVIVSEPLLIGERLRDMVELEDGRIGILTDTHRLLMLANAQRSNTKAPGSPFAVGRTKPDVAAWISGALSQGDASEGEDLFDFNCADCHSVKPRGQALAGPQLTCIFGAAIGAREDFNYSTAMTDLPDEFWSPENLDAFIEDPTAWLPGTTMRPFELSDEESRKHVLAYLAKLKSKKCK
jgi:cytochrome c2